MKASIDKLLRHIDLDSATITGATSQQRRLSDLAGCFVDVAAYDALLGQGDAEVYSVATPEGPDGAGDLAFGLGIVQPGRVGDEYFLTKGHYHSWREAAEVYIGLGGHGGLVLEDDHGMSQFVPLAEHDVVYVPGCTAHRTVNTGDEPLTYLGIYPATAGHDYAGIAADGFRLVVVAGPDGPQAMPRADYLKNLQVKEGHR